MPLTIFAYRTVILLVNDHIAFSTFLIHVYVFAEFIHNVVLYVELYMYYSVLPCTVCHVYIFMLYPQSPIWATGIE